MQIVEWSFVTKINELGLSWV